ncbi:hypothetical protein ACFQZ4_12585 [Catellatospora coxensis]
MPIPHPDAALLRALLVQHEDASGTWPALLWRAGDGWQMISSAVLGGGTAPARGCSTPRSATGTPGSTRTGT